MLGVLAGCAQAPAGSEPQASEPQAEPGQTPKPEAAATPAMGGSDGPEAVSALSFRYAGSESEVLEALRNAAQRQAYANAVMMEDAAEPEGNGSGGYYVTNHQVENVDEGDILKTDGEYIYALSGSEVIVFRAGGEDTGVVGRISVGRSESSDNGSVVEKTPSEIYVQDGVLAVISDYNSYDANSYVSQEYTTVEFYGLADPAAPVLISSMGQDGYMSASRVTGGKLYTVTGYYVWSYDEEQPDTYLPGIYGEGDRVNLQAEDICILPEPSGAGYSIVCQYDMVTGQRTAQLSVSGAPGSLYMDTESLYLSNMRSRLTESESYAESVYTVTDCVRSTVTDVTRIDLDSLRVTAAATVDGQLNDQFSMDARDGYLRMVTTSGKTAYKKYVDDKMGFENYVYDDETPSSNSLYILDSGLEPVGALEGLARGERVYSVRFNGDMAYFCTFKNVDPLFAVDVSDPRAPRLLGELKISGFSEYLHVWDDGLLLGIGLEADEETGAVGSMKLVMFDNSDPANVTVKSTLQVGCDYSPVLYDHRAAFVDREHNIIGFEDSQNGRYLIYGYDGSGFRLRTELELGSGYWGSRGLYIGDFAYVFMEHSMSVLRLDSLETVTSVELAVG